MDPSGSGSPPPQNDPHRDRDDQDGPDSDRHPVQRPTGGKSALGGEPETKLEADAQDRTGKFDQEESRPGKVDQATDRDAHRARPGDEA